jgi:hypothetical protein
MAWSGSVLSGVKVLFRRCIVHQLSPLDTLDTLS